MGRRCAIFCKSFRDDIPRVRNLLASYEQYGGDFIMLLSVPETDREIFTASLNIPASVILLNDEDYVSPLAAGQGGWVHQQICKLSIDELDFADAYLMVDSDTYFIAKPVLADFYQNDKRSIVFSSLSTNFSNSNRRLTDFILREEGSRHQACDLPSESRGQITSFGENLEEFRQWRAKNPAVHPVESGPWINSLFKIPLGVAFQPGQIFHKSILQQLREFMYFYGLSTIDMIKLAPWEYNWYGAFASAYYADEVARIISPIVHFPTTESAATAKEVGISTNTLAKKFPIVQMAARHFETIRFE